MGNEVRLLAIVGAVVLAIAQFTKPPPCPPVNEKVLDLLAAGIERERAGLASDKAEVEALRKSLESKKCIPAISSSSAPADPEPEWINPPPDREDLTWAFPDGDHIEQPLTLALMKPRRIVAIPPDRFPKPYGPTVQNTPIPGADLLMVSGVGLLFLARFI